MRLASGFSRILAVLAGLHAATASAVLAPPPAVTLNAPQRTPELVALEISLDSAARGMAPRIPLAFERPVAIEVVADYVEQAKRAGAVGEAVPATDGRADLLLVFHPEDAPFYRHALGRQLLARGGVAASLPPWIAHGAALWLSEEWYGRPYRDWLPTLAAAEVWPTAAELLATQEQRDGSEILWAPVAAALIEVRPGKTLTARLARPWSEAEVAPALERLRREALAGAGPVPGRRPWPRRGFLRGVSFAMLNGVEVGYHAPSADQSLGRLAGLGADAVSIMPFAFQRDPAQPTIAFLRQRPSSETDVGCLHAARRARARGMKVLWKPHLWLRGSWPGEVAFADEAGWQAWWRGYRRFVLHHAFLARRAGVELFSVGVELDKTVLRQAEWRHLIGSVRRVFPGAVTYASNWWGGLDAVPFWDALDVGAVDAYFPLADNAEATAAELARGARAVAEKLAAESRRIGLPLMLTEVGFAARKGAWTAPHEEGGVLSEADQAAAYRALLSALERQPWLAGLFVWKAFSFELPPGPEADFRFLGRAAEAEIRRYFTTGR
ncbi:MAG TPA: hypothetical protein VF017_18295 [Thermoanaerobaculia bacterium]|nr:hypothetical protein [Thermoanaerobaculia bacterium]